MAKTRVSGRNVLILWRWENAEEYLGWPCKSSIGGQMKGMRKGDTLYIVATLHNELYLLGSIRVHRVSREQHSTARKSYGDYRAHGRNLSGPFQIIPLGAKKWKLRFDGSKSPSLDRRVKVSDQVRQHRYLTPESARLLSEILKSGRTAEQTIQSEFAREGKAMEKSLTVRERDPKVRKAALQLYGWRCMACGFDFVETYGDFARDCVEVHHLKMISDPKRDKVATRIEDVIVLCPNCHRALHRFDHCGAWKRFQSECNLA